MPPSPSPSPTFVHTNKRGLELTPPQQANAGKSETRDRPRGRAAGQGSAECRQDGALRALALGGRGGEAGGLQAQRQAPRGSGQRDDPRRERAGNPQAHRLAQHRPRRRDQDRRGLRLAIAARRRQSPAPLRDEGTFHRVSTLPPSAGAPHPPAFTAQNRARGLRSGARVGLPGRVRALLPAGCALLQGARLVAELEHKHRAERESEAVYAVLKIAGNVFSVLCCEIPRATDPSGSTPPPSP